MAIVSLCLISVVAAAPSSQFSFTNISTRTTGFAFELNLAPWMFGGTFRENMYNIDITLTDIEITSENIYAAPTSMYEQGNSYTGFTIILPSNPTPSSSSTTSSSTTTTKISFKGVRFPRWQSPPGELIGSVFKGSFQGRIVNPATASYALEIDWSSRFGMYDQIPPTKIAPNYMSVFSQDFTFKYSPKKDAYGRKYSSFTYQFNGLNDELWDMRDWVRLVETFSITDISPMTTKGGIVARFALVDDKSPAGCKFNGIDTEVYLSPWAEAANTLSVTPQLFVKVKRPDFTLTCDNVGLYPPQGPEAGPEAPGLVRALAVGVDGQHFSSDKWVEGV